MVVSDSTSNHCKMRFSYSDGERKEIETLWVKPLDGQLFEVDNIPFYVQGIAWGDVVRGQVVDGDLSFESVHKASGHSTLRVLVKTEADVQAVTAALNAAGCDIEIADLKTLCAVDVPREVSYAVVSQVMQSLGDKIFDYEEAALSDVHRS